MFKNIYNLLNLFCGVLLIFLQYCANIQPSYFKGFESITLLMPFMITSNGLLLLYGLLRKRKAFYIPLISLCICFSSIQKFYFLSSLSFTDQRATSASLEEKFKSRISKKTLRILTFNSLSFYRFGILPREKYEDEFIAYIQQKQPDVIGFQETYIGKKSPLRALYPYGILQDPAAPKTRISYPIISKYPIVAKGRVQRNDTKTSASLQAKDQKPFDAFYADIRMEERTLRFYNIHLQSFHVNTHIDSLMATKKSSFSQINRTFVYQEKEVATLKNHIQNSPYPCVLLGDFNNTPFSYVYQELTSETNLKDTYLCNGQNTQFGATYIRPWFYPLRIDYILVPKQSKVLKYEIHKTPNWSDHYPVFAEILW